MFTLYVVLDTFVITRVYTILPANPVTQNDATQDGTTQNGTTQNSTTQNGTTQNSETSPPTEGNNASSDNSKPKTLSDSTEQLSGQAVAEQQIITQNTYSDVNINITLTEYREHDTAIYVADVQVSSPEYLKTAFAQNAYGKNITDKTSVIAEENEAILAINGDFYGAQTRGYVLRNGTVYRESAKSGQEDLVIWNDGSFEIITEGNVSATALSEKGAAQVLSFGPALVENGDIVVSENDEIGRAMTSNPRTAIGIIDDLHYLFVVSDGRTRESSGLSLYQLAEFMKDVSVVTAYNLDGGGSSTMVFNGEIINNPTTNGNRISERRVSDIVYIGY